MGLRIHNIEGILFVPHLRHTVFTGQTSTEVEHHFCVQEIAPGRNTSPLTGADCSIGLLNANIQKAADFVSWYKIGHFLLRLPEPRNKGPPPPICFHQKQIGGKENV